MLYLAVLKNPKGKVKVNVDLYSASSWTRL